MRVSKRIIFSLISIIVALIVIFSVYIYVSVPIPSNSPNKIVQISFDDVYHLLGADDEGRISYNLNRLQSDSLYALRAYIYDSIYYHKTDIRIERMECFPLDLLNYQNKDTITLFSHEWAMNGHRNILNRIKLRQSIKWLAKNNYKFSFLE